MKCTSPLSQGSWVYLATLAFLTDAEKPQPTADPSATRIPGEWPWKVIYSHCLEWFYSNTLHFFREDYYVITAWWWLVAKPCLILCDPTDCSPPGSSLHGISQARILEWAALPFSRGSSPPRGQPTSPELAGGFSTTEPPGIFWSLFKKKH